MLKEGIATIRGKKGSVGLSGQGDGLRNYGLREGTSLGMSGGGERTRAE